MAVGAIGSTPLHNCQGPCGVSNGSQTWIRTCTNPPPCNNGQNRTAYNPSAVTYPGGIQTETNNRSCNTSSCPAGSSGCVCKKSVFLNKDK